MSATMAGSPARGAAGVTAVTVPVPRVGGVAILTGWGDGLAGLPTAPPAVVPLLVPVPTPVVSGDRFRRATRECLLAATVVREVVVQAGLDVGALAGERTGLLYVSASGYAAANRAFLEDQGSTTLHFPYTAPTAVPGEVTIEFAIRGPYVVLTGGATATLQAFWYAARWLAHGVADRILVLAVETMHEVRDLFSRSRRLYQAPLVEGAACALLEPGDAGTLAWASAASGRPATAVAAVLAAVLPDGVPAAAATGAVGPLGRAESGWLQDRAFAGPEVGYRVGEMLACGPLIGLARARAAGVRGPCLVTGGWRGEYGALVWPL
jgi:hypothetical protein